MTRAEIRDLNRRLAQFGLRFCPGCEATFDLTDEHWYFSRKGRDRTTCYPSSLCKRCFRFAASERGRERWRQDETYRKAKGEAWRQRMADPVFAAQRREHQKKTMQTKRRADRRLRFSQIIAGIESNRGAHPLRSAAPD